MPHPISTFKRFMYLNTYAFLLAIGGIGIVAVPLYHYSLWWLLLQIPVAFICLKGAYSIFSSWQDKKRKYNLLIERNTPVVRPDTFTEYMQAPCGKLLAKIVLADLNQPHVYKEELLKLRKPLWTVIKENCGPQKRTVYINPNYKPQNEKS